MSDLEGKVALVTGGSRGIGSAIAKQLARSGAHVLITYLSSAPEAATVIRSIEEQGGTAEAFQADVANESQMMSFVTDRQRMGRPIDILVNNAGSIKRPSSWNEQSSQDVRAALDLNFTAHLLLSRMVAPSMIERRYGRIVNVSSTYGLTGAAQVLAYTCAKSAIITLTYALARELGPCGITVNCVAPGNIDTDMTNAADKGVLDWVINSTPLHRLGQPEEVAELVDFLVRSQFINGSLILIDGGQILNM